MALRGFRLALRGAERLNDATARRLIEALRLAERDSSFGIIEAPGGDDVAGWLGCIPSREWSHIPPGEKENHLQRVFFWLVVSNIFYFQPLFGGRFPIWRAYYSDGLVQPPTSVGFEKIFPEVGFGEILILFPSKKCLEMLFIITCFNFQQLEITFISHCLVAIELMIMCCFNGWHLAKVLYRTWMGMFPICGRALSHHVSCSLYKQLVSTHAMSCQWSHMQSTWVKEMRMAKQMLEVITQYLVEYS